MEEVLALYRERFSETLEKIQAFKERVLRRWQQFLDFLVPTYLLIGIVLVVSHREIRSNSVKD